MLRCSSSLRLTRRLLTISVTLYTYMSVLCSIRSLIIIQRNEYIIHLLCIGAGIFPKHVGSDQTETSVFHGKWI